MLDQRGQQNKPFIAGRSVHNQRIEILWREVWAGCVVTYYNIFFGMEDQGMLEPENELHLLALHMVYLPRIQEHLDRFAAALNRRPLRTERNRSPLQLWIAGQQFSGDIGEPLEEVDVLRYGIDYDGPTGTASDSSVHVPEMMSPVGTLHAQTQALLSQQSNCFGVDVYQQVLHAVQHIYRNA